MTSKKPSNQVQLRREVRRLMRYMRNSMPVPHERRRHERIQCIHPITVITSRGRRLECLSRDLSLEGIRLLCSQSLVGQTVRVVVPNPLAKDGWGFTLQVLWSEEVGDGLVDCGGRLLEVAQTDE